MQKEALRSNSVQAGAVCQGIKTTGGTIVWITGQVSQDKDGKVVHQGDFPEASTPGWQSQGHGWRPPAGPFRISSKVEPID
jgi:hypothetical protein